MLRVRLPDPRGELAEWRGASESVDRVGRLSGGALATALLFESAARDPAADAPLVVAVGDGVRRGIPTASRATVASRAPLTGLFADGQVGGDLGRRLASVCDALVVEGRVEGRRVLHVCPDGSVELERAEGLAGASPAETHARLRERFGACATLSIGVAGERGLAMACLAGGGDPPHFVGRGGLGAVLGKSGLVALAIEAPERPDIGAAGGTELVSALLASPRLEGRAEGGTLELFDSLAARGELYARGERARLERGQGAALVAGAAASRERRHGCKGCPTPCGWIFSAGHREQGARFGAAHALGVNLGLDRFEDSLGLLARCDAIGVDAKELGAALAILCTARERERVPGGPLWGDREGLIEGVDELARGEGTGARLGRGALAFAREVGLEGELRHLRGAAVRPQRDPASLLGQCVSTRGSDPMRTFPFLVTDSSARERLGELIAPLSVPAGAEDPERPEGKGRLVWWHENLAVALDATGFCSFSAAALLADGTCSLGRLAEWLVPAGPDGPMGDEARAARELLGAGERIVHLQRRLNRTWGGAGAGGLPDWARGQLDRPGLWPEYRALRGLDPGGDPTPEAEERFDRGELPSSGAELPATGTAPPAAEPAPSRRAPGRVVLVSSGLLARAIGAECELELELPAPLAEVLAAAAERAGGEGRSVLAGERAPPVVYREGRRVAPGDPVADGDRLDLLLVISGGAG